MSQEIQYELYDREEYLGCYTAREIQALIGFESKRVWNYADNGCCYQGRYRFVIPERLEQEEWRREWQEEWERVRREVLGKLGALGKKCV